jgi:hypothetical protein
MQPVARHLQQLEYNNRNRGVFYMVSAGEYSACGYNRATCSWGI